MASILKVDELQGKTTAGDITVTSEGGAATQSLQQGLAKAWCIFNGQLATPVLNDSLNCSSLTDSGTGVYNPQLTNAMSSANFVSATSAHASGVAWTAAVYVGGRTTSQMHYQTVLSSNQTAVDSNPCDIVSFGDLA
tara:strand:+ start:113 stop:523 length:411 start_codon:yes stop_codon:yes gene_type:complete